MHKKKVEEIRHWLEQADASLQLGLPPSPRMLVLSGPPGAAKSAALRTVAGELGFELCEWLEGRTLRWVSPTDDWSGGGGNHSSADYAGYESRLSQFGHFLSSSLRTLSLSMVSAGAAPPAAARSACTPASLPAACPPPVCRLGLRRRLVLLEELPVSGSSGERATSMLQEQQVRTTHTHTPRHGVLDSAVPSPACRWRLFWASPFSPFSPPFHTHTSPPQTVLRRTFAIARFSIASIPCFPFLAPFRPPTFHHATF
jgi:DNA polymerase III delta prime subunit